MAFGVKVKKKMEEEEVEEGGSVDQPIRNLPRFSSILLSLSLSSLFCLCSGGVSSRGELALAESPPKHGRGNVDLLNVERSTGNPPSHRVPQPSLKGEFG